jgi:broad specificity phosphatase PhoE
MLLYLARHGETEWNVQKRIQGWGNSPLTEYGRAQARSLASRLSGDPITAVYCSDLQRALDTAHIIAAGRGIPVVALPDLREISWGQWEGKTVAEIMEEDPQRWARYIAHGHENPAVEERADWESTTEVPDGETVGQASARVLRALEQILRDHSAEDETVLVVGHGGSRRFFFTHALGLKARRIRRFQLGNASLSSILYLKGHPPIVQSINDTGHHEVA